MSEEDFLAATTQELEAATGVNRFQWSRYFNGALMSEKSIYAIAGALEMSHLTFFVILNIRRNLHSKRLRVVKRGRTSQ